MGAEVQTNNRYPEIFVTYDNREFGNNLLLVAGTVVTK